MYNTHNIVTVKTATLRRNTSNILQPRRHATYTHRNTYEIEVSKQHITIHIGIIAEFNQLKGLYYYYYDYYYYYYYCYCYYYYYYYHYYYYYYY